MVYITDGTKKTKYGITVDKMICRTWVLLDNKDYLNIVRIYPGVFFSNDFFKKILKIDELKNIDNNSEFKSKYPIEPIYFKKGKSSFIYQDGTSFDKEKNIVKSCSGLYYYERGDSYSYEGSIFYGNKRFGLKGLIDSNQAINHYIEETVNCTNCGESIYEDECNYFNNDYYCEYCYNEIFLCCDTCCETFYIEELIYFNDDYYCEYCFDKYFTSCKECDKDLLIEDAREIDNDCYCEDCYIEIFSCCDECYDVVKNEDIINFSNKVFCKDCFDTKYFHCETCSEVFSKEDSLKYNNLFFCEDCYKEMNGEDLFSKEELFKIQTIKKVAS